MVPLDKKMVLIFKWSLIIDLSFKLKFSVLFAIYKVMSLFFYLYFWRVYSLGFNYLRIHVVCVCVWVCVLRRKAEIRLKWVKVFIKEYVKTSWLNPVFKEKFSSRRIFLPLALKYLGEPWKSYWISIPCL